ncbi:Nuclear pore protein [Entamoeba marina]
MQGSLYLFLVLILSVFSHTSSMNVPSVLLPYPTRYQPITYTLEATNGCFVWTTNNPSIVSLHPNDKQKCSNQCVITISYSAQSNQRQSFWIYATDEQQHVNLRTEITIDNIHDIEIVTTTRLMNKDDYEVLEIAGYDVIGNKFSTLEGIPVTWSIGTVNGTKGNGGDYVRIEKFASVANLLKIKTSKSILDLEERGLETSKIIVKGLELGKAEMSAQLLTEPQKNSSVVLTVLQMLVLIPEHDVYVLPNTEVMYEVHTTKRNELGPIIKMPNANYNWSSTSLNTVTVQSNGLATAVKKGTSTIAVMYIGTPESKQKRNIHVVHAHKIRLRWKEIRTTWQWVSGRTYEVTPELFDSNDNIISYVKNPNFKITPKNVEVVSHETGYTSFIVKTKNVGRASIYASFQQEGGFFSSGIVSCSQDIIVSNQVIASPHTLRLAVPATSGCKIEATGGQGEYVYHIDNDVCTVTNDGIVIARNVGKAIVTVIDSRNNENYDSVVIEALEVGSVEIRGEMTESIIGSVLQFNAVAKDGQGRYFETCSSALVDWKVMHDVYGIIGNSTGTTVSIQALKPGSTTLVATYGKGIAEVHILAFDPLTLKPKTQRSPHVSKASGFIVSYEGGPIPWYLQKNLYYMKSSLTSNIAEIIQLENNELLVVCKEYGQATLFVEVGNAIGKTHNYTSSTTSNLQFQCSEPAVLMLSSQDIYLHEHNGDSVKSSIPSMCRERAVQSDKNVKSEMTIRVGEEIDLVGYVKPSVSGMFTNTSSIDYKWSISNDKLLKMTHPEKSEEHSSVHLSVYDITGKVELTLTAIKYDWKYFKAIGLSSRQLSISKTLERTITLNIVDVVSVSPKQITLFNHPQNSAVLTARSGSGFYNFTTDSPNHISLEHYSTDSTCVVRPRNESNVYVIANDVCFTGKSDEARIAVTVSDIHAVNVIVTDQIETGESTTLTFEAIDINGHPFDESQYKFMDIKASADNGNVFIERKNTLEYVITGSTHGMTVIIITINNVASKPVNLIVYEHFTCTPKEVRLIPLAQEDIKCRGGPPLRSTITHSVIQGDAVELDGYKIIGQTRGSSVIQSSISYIDSVTGEKIEKGKEMCDVIVRHLTGLRMEAHQTTIEVGGQTKVRVIGEADGVPVSIAATQLDFVWEQTDDLALDVFSVYHDANISANTETSHTVLLYGKSAGQSRISVSVAGIQKGLPAIYKELSASILLHIIEPFSSHCAGHCRNVIDIPVHSTTQITTNRDPKAVSFSICGSDIITVDSNGIITSYSTPGSTIVHATETETGEILSYVVKVHRIHAIELLPLNPKPTISAGEVIRYEIIPIGDRGRILQPSYSKLVHFDVIPSGSAAVTQGSNMSIVEVNIAKPGKVIIRATSNEAARLQDEVRVTVHHSVTPLNPIVLIGSDIQFTTAAEPNAQWISDNKDIVSVNYNGKATAKSVGTTVVSTVSQVFTGRQHSLSTPAVTNVIVSNLESIAVEQITVGSAEVFVPITLYAADGIVSQSSNINLHLNGHCKIESTDVATASLVIKQGKVGCVVKATTSRRTIPSEVKLSVVINDNQNGKIQTSVKLPFTPGMTISHDHLRLKPQENVRFSVERANGEVTIRDMNNYLTIEKRSDGAFNIKGANKGEGEIEVSDGSNKVHVKYTIGISKSKGLWKWSYTPIAIVVIILIIYFLISFGI